MKLALQIYTLRSHLGENELGDTLARVRDMGYDGVEWFGLMGYTPAALAKLTEDAGLEFFSVHINLDDLTVCDTALLDELAAAGAKYLPIVWLPEERIAGGAKFEETCELIRKYSAEAAARGMKVLYHNHDFDLARLEDGTPKLDALYAALPGDVLCAELDTCWLYTGKVDPEAYVRKYADRAPLIHLKDCVSGGGREVFRPVGYGVLDWDGILSAAKAADVPWVCVEQDDPSEGEGMDDFRCVELSAAFLKEKLG